MESDRQREETRRKAQDELARFLADYAAKVEERKARPVDMSAFLTEFDGKPTAGTASADVDWEAVGRLIKLLPPPPAGQATDRFLQLVQSKTSS